MKKLTAVFLAMLLLCGCAAIEEGGETLPAGDFSSPQETGASQCLSILTRVWEQYSAEAPFSVYGGSPAQPVYGAPAVLPDGSRRILETQFSIPSELSGKLSEGAAVTHLFSEKVFRAAVFYLPSGADSAAVAGKITRRLRVDAPLKQPPQRLLAAEAAPGYLVLASGDAEYVTLFADKLQALFGGTKIFFLDMLPKAV